MSKSSDFHPPPPPREISAADTKRSITKSVRSAFPSLGPYLATEAAAGCTNCRVHKRVPISQDRVNLGKQFVEGEEHHHKSPSNTYTEGPFLCLSVANGKPMFTRHWYLLDIFFLDKRVEQYQRKYQSFLFLIGTSVPTNPKFFSMCFEAVSKTALPYLSDLLYLYIPTHSFNTCTFGLFQKFQR